MSGISRLPGTCTNRVAGVTEQTPEWLKRAARDATVPNSERSEVLIERFRNISRVALTASTVQTQT